MQSGSEANLWKQIALFLITLGIRPTRPDTGYGYIQYLEEKEEDGMYKVKTFVEKPPIEMATTFYQSGDFLWNAGIFAWKVKAVAIQLRPSMNWPRPNPQPFSRARRNEPVRLMSSHNRAKAAGIKGHQPTGWNAKAERMPRPKASAKDFIARLASRREAKGLAGFAHGYAAVPPRFPGSRPGRRP